MLGFKYNGDKILEPCVSAMCIFKCFMLYNKCHFDIVTWKYKIYHNPLRSTISRSLLLLNQPTLTTVFLTLKGNSSFLSKGNIIITFSFHNLDSIHHQSPWVYLQNTPRNWIFLSTSSKIIKAQPIIISPGILQEASNLSHCFHLYVSIFCL